MSGAANVATVTMQACQRSDAWYLPRNLHADPTTALAVLALNRLLAGASMPGKRET